MALRAWHERARRLGDLSRDFHSREPLQDLIDPNLFPRKLSELEQELALAVRARTAACCVRAACVRAAD